MTAAIAPNTLSDILDNVQISCPFDFLGIHPHPSGKGLIIRFWHPEARTSVLIQQPKSIQLGQMTEVSPGIFELHLKRRRKRFNYQVQVQFKDGVVKTFFDSYQFGEYILKQQDIEPSALYRHLGAHLRTHVIDKNHQVSGTLFKVYAPNARAVSVVGSFNSWDGRIHPMASADDGIWRLFIPGVKTDDLYKFEIHDQNGNLLPLKTDPFGRYAEQWPGLASIVTCTHQYQWNDRSWLEQRKQPHQAPMSIYEVHLGSWQHRDNGQLLNYNELAEHLIPYVKEMGFTHIELMPVNEHPHDDSWGYQSTGLFAPTSRYGRPDDFKYFIDQCHQAGIGVIMDWVPASFPSDAHGLARFDGTGIYEQQQTGADCLTQIYDYENRWVQDFLISSALFWLDEFHIDGLRINAVDSILHLRDGHHRQWAENVPAGSEHQAAVAFLCRLNRLAGLYFPDCMTIAEESTSRSGVTRRVDQDGLGFGFKWNTGWMHDSLQYMERASEHRKYHHAELSFSMIYAYSENFLLTLSHDEVSHGRGSLLQRMAGDRWQQFANLRAYFGMMFGHPGKKLIFMGNELACEQEWDIHTTLDWAHLQNPMHQGMQTLIRDLNHTYQAVPALSEADYLREGFCWLIVDDHEHSVYAWYRKDAAGQYLLVICNMTPVIRTHYQVGVPVKGTWTEIINTDRAVYGGSNLRNPDIEISPEPAHGQQQSLSLTLPPLSTLMLQARE